MAKYKKGFTMRLRDDLDKWAVEEAEERELTKAGFIRLLIKQEKKRMELIARIENNRG